MQQVQNVHTETKPAPQPTEDPDVASSPMEYITPNDVGRLIVEAIQQGKPHAFTHPAPVDLLQARLDDLLAGQPQPAPR